jgi:hypothetical protein
MPPAAMADVGHFDSHPSFRALDYEVGPVVVLRHSARDGMQTAKQLKRYRFTFLLPLRHCDPAPLHPCGKGQQVKSNADSPCCCQHSV